MCGVVEEKVSLKMDTLEPMGNIHFGRKWILLAIEHGSYSGYIPRNSERDHRLPLTGRSILYEDACNAQHASKPET